MASSSLLDQRHIHVVMNGLDGSIDEPELQWMMTTSMPTAGPFGRTKQDLLDSL